MTIDDLDSWPRCQVEGCLWQVWPPVAEPRCPEHGGNPEEAIYSDEWGLTTTWHRPDELTVPLWEEGIA